MKILYEVEDTCRFCRLQAENKRLKDIMLKVDVGCQEIVVLLEEPTDCSTAAKIATKLWKAAKQALKDVKDGKADRPE